MLLNETNSVASRSLWLPVLAVFGALVVTQVQAGWAWRGLYADGSNYLLQMFVRDGFSIAERARATSQVVMQAPTAFYLALGGAFPGVAATLFSLALNVIPFLLIALSALLCPPRQPHVAWFPMFVCFAAMAATSVPAIADGNFAAGYVWVALMLLIWRSRTLAGQVGLALLALPMLALHEGMVLLGPVLALAAIWRAVRTSRPRERIGFGALALWFMVCAAVEGRWLLFPADSGNRDSLFGRVLQLRWLGSDVTGLNAPALLGLLAAAAICAVVLTRRPSLRITAAFAAAALGLTATMWWSGFGMAPEAQFDARHNPVLLSVPTGLLMLAAAARPLLLKRLPQRQVGTILIGLGLSTTACNVAATQSWQAYVTAFQDILRSHSGLVSDAAAWSDRPVRQQRAHGEMSWSWTNPGMSLVLAPDGQVRTIIANPPATVWQPFDPADPAGLPQSRLLDLRPYARAMSGSAGH